MFVNYSILKKMIKMAYEHHALTVACTSDLVIIQSAKWGISVRRSFLHNKVMAALAEFIGELPPQGEAWSYIKNGKNMEKQEELLETIEGYFMYKPGKRYSKTDVYVRTFESLYQIYESDDKSKLYINSVFTGLIDAMNVETERGEIQPQKWTTGQNGLIYITNNVMTLYCNYYHGQTELETELLSLIGDTSLLEKDMLVKKGEA